MSTAGRAQRVSMPKQIIQRADSILQSVTHCDALNTISDLDNPEVLCGKIKIFQSPILET